VSHRTLHTVERLLESLETLASQESSLLALDAWSDHAALQERSGTLINRIEELMRDRTLHRSLSPELRARVAKISAMQGRTLQLLQDRMSTCREELNSLGSTQIRVQTIRPAYRSEPGHRVRPPFFQQG
jgi:hypothetical protein